PLTGVVCLLTKGVLIRVRPGFWQGRRPRVLRFSFILATDSNSISRDPSFALDHDARRTVTRAHSTISGVRWRSGGRYAVPVPLNLASCSAIGSCPCAATA